jgi:Uma2 family endonuclease
MGADPVVQPITVDEWHALVDAGLLDGHRVQLIKGQKVLMSPESPRHSGMIDELARRLHQQSLQSGAGQTSYVRQQHPVTLAPHDEPEPDLAVVRGRPHDYRRRHPVAQDVLLAVEVSLVTRAFDLTTKAARYSEAGIGEYWVVDLARDAVVQHLEPSQRGYDHVEVVPFGRPVAARVLGLTVVVD